MNPDWTERDWEGRARRAESKPTARKERNKLEAFRITFAPDHHVYVRCRTAELLIAHINKHWPLQRYTERSVKDGVNYTSNRAPLITINPYGYRSIDYLGEVDEPSMDEDDEAEAEADHEYHTRKDEGLI
jgi:hypothetical protein